jgi:hypothetical protein
MSVLPAAVPGSATADQPSDIVEQPLVIQSEFLEPFRRAPGGSGTAIQKKRPPGKIPGVAIGRTQSDKLQMCSS